MYKHARSLALVGAVALMAISSAKAASLADWTFQNGATGATASNFTYGKAEAGVFAASSSATGFHASSATVWSTPVGDASSVSFSSNNWSQGDYYAFSLATTGYQAINVSFEMTDSATGPKTFGLFYSTDGGASFVQAGSSFSLAATSWSGTGSVKASTESFDLSTISALNGKTAVYFRVEDMSATAGGAENGSNVATTGTARIDDFLVTGTASAVPEPSTYALVLGATILGFVALKRRKSAITA